MTITLTSAEVREAVAFYLSQKFDVQNVLVSYDLNSRTYSATTNSAQDDIDKQAIFARYDLSVVDNRGYHVNYIPAIKWVRENYGLGLKEAKEFVDRFRTW